MPENGDPGGLDRSDEAARLVAGVAESGVDRRDHGLELGNARGENVDRPVLGDVRLGAEEHREAPVGPVVRPVHLPPLGPEVAREEPAGHVAVARVVGQEGVPVAAGVEGPWREPSDIRPSDRSV